MKDIVICAAGASSPIGLSLDEVFNSLVAGQGALAPIERFDTSRLRTGIGGEVERERLADLLGQKVLSVPFLQQELDLAGNPKLAFALAACSQALTGSSSLSAQLPAWCEEVALYTTAGLEEVSVEVLWQGAQKDRPVCYELPPTYLGEVLASVFSMTAHPPTTVVSACASSTQSIGEAARAIDNGFIEMALAGGTDSMLFPFGINAFNSLSALAEGHDDSCRLAPFDEGRKGTLLGEGAAFFLLCRREKAEALGLSAICEVIGYSSSLDGYHPVKPHPKGAGAKLALERALADGQLEPDKVDYINAHGSGTFHNDIVETLVINEVFAGRRLPVSSTKPFYGHLLTAGGAIELLSILCAFTKGHIPPTLNFVKEDERCDLDCVPNEARSSKVDVALSNSFGLHGQNGVLVLRAIENERQGE